MDMAAGTICKMKFVFVGLNADDIRIRDGVAEVFRCRFRGREAHSS